MENNFIVTTEVYSLNERRFEVDLPPLERDTFEYEVTLLCEGCGDVVAEFDSQEGQQLFQLYRDKRTATFSASQTEAEITADIAEGKIDSWFRRIKKCSCI